MINEGQGFQRVLSRKDILALSFGAIIGKVLLLSFRQKAITLSEQSMRESSYLIDKLIERFC